MTEMQVNATDTASTESVMLEFLAKHEFQDDDWLLLVQATSPLLQSSDIDHALATLAEQQADSLLTCVRSKRFYWHEQGTAYNYDYRNRPRRQDFAGTLMENGAFIY